jgi:hypothetical protein
MLSPSSVDFGTLYVGDIGVKTVTLTNTGQASMTVQDPFLFDVGNGDSNEFIALNLCPRSLAAGRSCTFYLAFYAGPKYNQQTAILKVNDNAPGSPQSVPLTATVINPAASFSPNSLRFGSVRLGSSARSNVVLTNSGATPLTISGMNVAGGVSGEFTLTNSCPASLAPRAQCTIPITFAPARSGSRSAYLNVTDNARGGSQQVSLSGTGVGAP